MADTIWCGQGFPEGHLYLTSGEFSSTLLTSEDIYAHDQSCFDVSWDGINTLWIGAQNDKMFLQSGLFTSTILTSQAASDTQPLGINSNDGVDTLYTGNQPVGYLYLISGQFSSTMKTSMNVESVDEAPGNCVWDGTNTPWIGQGGDKMYLNSGQFTTSMLTSQATTGMSSPRGTSWNGTDTMWCGYGGRVELVLTSGQFSSTIKDSLNTNSIETQPQGIETTDFNARVGETRVFLPALSLTSAQPVTILPGLEVIVAVSALSISSSQGAVSFAADCSVALAALTIGAALDGLTLLAGADVFVSLLPQSLGISTEISTVMGDTVLMLPGVPMIILDSALSLHAPEINVIDDIKIVVTNARTFAISEYNAMAFNSMAKFNGKYLYAKANGIYEGGGDNDDGAEIHASYKTGAMDINATEVQKLRNAFLNFRSSGDIQLFTVGNEVNTRLYPFVNSTTDTIHERRQKFERGIRDNHFSFGISNVAGSSFEIKTAKILTEPIRKRR
jgi:hypothetical protein